MKVNSRHLSDRYQTTNGKISSTGSTLSTTQAVFWSQTSPTSVMVSLYATWLHRSLATLTTKSRCLLSSITIMASTLSKWHRILTWHWTCSKQAQSLCLRAYSRWVLKTSLNLRYTATCSLRLCDKPRIWELSKYWRQAAHSRSTGPMRSVMSLSSMMVAKRTSSKRVLSSFRLQKRLTQQK